MQVGDIIERSPAVWNPKVLPVEFTWDPARKGKAVGIITGITTIEEGLMVLVGYIVEWSNGKKTVETGFTIRKVGR